VPIVVPLVALDVLVLVLWTIAAALAIALIMKEIGKVFSGIPVVGGAIAGAVNAVAQAVTWAVGKIETGIDKLIGAAWHLLAHYMDVLWHQIEGQASLLTQFAQMILNLTHAHALLRALVHRAVGTAQAILPRVKSLEREWHGIEHRVKVLERDIAKGIGHDLRIQVKALEREVTTIESKVIPKVESAEQALARDISALGDYIRSNFVSTATDAITAAVAVALGAMGLSGLRCNSLLNSLKNRGCGFWNGLEDLLGLFVDTLLLTNVCELLPILETVVSDVADPLVIALTDIGAGLCSGGIGAAPPLKVPALSLPANPGLTLNLP
jgi:hypothetical protein